MQEVSEIASKGGQASHSGGFASMDPEKQVSAIPIMHLYSQTLELSLMNGSTEGDCIHGR